MGIPFASPWNHSPRSIRAALRDDSLLRRARRILVASALFGLCAALGFTAAAGADASQVSFEDIAANGGAGIDYRRTASASEALYDAIREQPLYTFNDLLATPLKSRGAPGVAILDHDGDGDLDIYVTNGPGTANSLYANQLRETGALTFVDVGTDSGVDATAQDSMGVCFGDIDNDGDHDLFVLGNFEPNRLFENLGNGHFADITGSSGAGGGVRSSTSCSMGDIDGDGLLDIVVGNATDMRIQVAIFAEPFALNEPNQLLRNLGGNAFEDVSATSGILDLALPEGPPGASTITWAVALVDIDQDGDLDFIHGDDQAAIPVSALGGIDRGYIQLFANDGTGQFTAVGLVRGLDRAAPWMGLAFGDVDHNGTLDIFGSNFGNHSGAFFMGGIPDFSLANGDSRWFLQQADGSFVDSVMGDPLHSPFGWGASAADYDADGDTDFIFHGGLDVGPFVTTNPGSILRNDGFGNMSRDVDALAGSTDHVRRTVHGSAVGDLDEDGFVDIVSVSSQDLPADGPLVPSPELGGEFQADAFIMPTFVPVDPVNMVFTFSGLRLVDGTLAVERNSGNGNRSLAVEVRGSIGTVDGGAVNRDGIGAIVEVTPWRGRPVLAPVLGGSSYASQDALRQMFGLGSARRATVEVAWPGGVRNRRYSVRHGSRLIFPEIPCSIDAPMGFGSYLRCVVNSLHGLVDADVIERREASRFLGSAIFAYIQER